MKKLLCLVTASVIVFSSSLCIAYAKNDKDNNGNNGNNLKQEVSRSADSTVKADEAKSDVQADKAKEYIETLKDKLKELHKDKDKRKELIKEIVSMRRQNNDNSIPVFVAGKEVEFDVPPVIKDDRTLIPVRAVTNALGADVQWNELTSTATVTKAVYSDVYGTQNIKIEMNLETKVVLVNGSEVKLDVPPQLFNNRTMIPLRFIAETFKKEVEWDQDSQAVTIEEKYELNVAGEPVTKTAPVSTEQKISAPNT